MKLIMQPTFKDGIMYKCKDVYTSALKQQNAESGHIIHFDGKRTISFCYCVDKVTESARTAC